MSSNRNALELLGLSAIPQTCIAPHRQPFPARVAHSPCQLGSVQDSIARLEGLLLHIGGSSYVFLTTFALDLLLSIPVPPFFAYLWTIYTFSALALDCRAPHDHSIKFLTFWTSIIIICNTMQLVASSIIPIRLLSFVLCSHFSARSILVLYPPRLAYMHHRIWPRRRSGN